MKIEGIGNSLAVTKSVENITNKASKDDSAVKNNIPIELSRIEKDKNDLLEKQKSVENAVNLINKTMANYNTEIRFTLHKQSGEYLVKVINTTDDSVIREIPPERVLDMVAHFKRMLGLVVDRFI